MPWLFVVSGEKRGWWGYKWGMNKLISGSDVEVCKLFQADKSQLLKCLAY